MSLQFIASRHFQTSLAKHAGQVTRSHTNASTNRGQIACSKRMNSAILQQQQRRKLSSSGKQPSKNKEDMPPLPDSPLKAKRRYLESKKNLDNAQGDLIDVNARITQLNKELDAVRDRNAALLDKELNKPIWRKLTDPLKRYRHSVYNMVAISLAYVLAHKLYIARKDEKNAQELLTEATDAKQRLQGILASLLDDASLSEIASNCAEVIVEDEESSRKAKGGWFSSKGKLGIFFHSERQEQLRDQLIPIIKSDLEKKIGDAALSEEALKEKLMNQVIEESKNQLDDLSENPEQFLAALLAESEEAVDDTGTDEQGNRIVKKRVFSM